MQNITQQTRLQLTHDDTPHVHIAHRRPRTRVWVVAMRVFEHCEAFPAPCGGGTVTRSMRRVANATLLRFDRVTTSPGLAHRETPDPITATHGGRV